LFPLSPELIVKFAKSHIKIYYQKVEKVLKMSGTSVPFHLVVAGLRPLALFGFGQDMSYIDGRIDPAAPVDHGLFTVAWGVRLEPFGEHTEMHVARGG
jgi:hypothetical protein